jgi:hypothetical protein
MKRSIIHLYKQRDQLNKRIAYIQSKCKHTNKEEAHGSRGDMGDGDLIFWTIYHCLDCDKHWSVTSE